ncbi:hypothetical protein [Actinoplanes sp. NPDC023714]|uniref:hypothetical protein n=1 Tax=Actinoplanes sp. NPDC023714 TaxID=3154322 RepID=UPI0033C86316
MTANALPAAGDPRRLLADMRTLAHRVRLDQRMTGAALLVLAAATFAAIPFDWFGMQVNCLPDGGCQFARNGMLYYWPAAMPLAYAAIAVIHVRAARRRGVGARILPYAITGAATAVVFPAAWIAVQLYLADNPVPAGPLPYWYLVLDRLVMPWGMIGVTLLILTWLERNVPLLLFTLAYLALVLLVLPMNEGLAFPDIRASMAAPQLVAGAVLLLAGLGFRAANRRRP